MIGQRPRRRRRKPGEQGFTLIEVLISLVLLAIVLGLLTGAVRYARATWDAAARLDREAGYDVASFVRARLGEAMPLFEPTESGVVCVAFKGASDSVQFVAPTQNGPAGAGLYRFVLEVARTSAGKSSALLVRLAPYHSKQEKDAAGLPLEDHVLAENVKSVGFRSELRATPAWHAAWTRTDALPDLVEMSITYSDRDSNAPLIVELRLRQRPRTPLD
jgi:prepilin-type N-terminal cleavage/methylation domain-containing protein